MNKADAYYIKNLKNILENGFWDENPRPKYKDGTPAHSKFITGVYETYDISKGEFPITTLRNTAIKTGIREILWIYQKQSNCIESAREMGITWWDEWMNSNGNLDRAYSHNLESHRPKEMKRLVKKVKPIILDVNVFKVIPLEKVQEIRESIDNKIYESKYRCYGKYIIINEYIKDNRVYIDCQFLQTGYICSIRKDSFKKNQHPTDNFVRTLYSVGYLGNYVNVQNFTKFEVKALKKIWLDMIKRCYDNTKPDYGKIFVHQDWHSFENFLRDIRYVPQYHLAKEDDFIGWELDKDYYGSNGYSKDTCAFLLKSENILYRKTQIPPIKIIDDRGNVFYELSYCSLARTLKLSNGYVRNVVKRGHYKNLKFSFVNDSENLYRYELSRNQINDLLKELKENPYGRRHMVSLWNWGNMDKKELVECAFMTMWSVRKNNEEYYLDMTLIQRSNDYVMAGYINKIQYVALQMMVAGHLGYKVGLFNHLTQNLHIYDRHFDAVNEMLDRRPLDIEPSIELKTNRNFYDYSMNDFLTYHSDIPKLCSSLEIGI